MMLDTLFSGLDLQLQDSHGVIYNTKSQHIELSDNSQTICFEFDNDEMVNNVIVAVTQSEDCICISARASLHTSAGWQMRNTFSGYNSLLLRLTPRDNAAQIMGSEYFLAPESECWAAAFFADSFTDIKKSTASLLWKQGEYYYHMLPLCDGPFKTGICGGSSTLDLSISPYTGGYTEINARMAVITRSKNPFELPEKTAAAGFKALGLKPMLAKDKALPEMFEYLGWCTWDAFRKEVNADGILEKAREFADKKLPVGWVLVDDGWFEFDDGKLVSMVEDKNKFPEGFKPVVDALKEKYGIKWIGAWQCFIAYWEGVQPDSALVDEISSLLTTTNGGFIIPKYDEASSTDFWNYWNEYLSKQGIEFVKVDVENALASYTHGEAAIGLAASGAHKGLDASVGMYYGGACINCTGMGHESLWNRRNGIVNRNSNDFMPLDISTMPSFIRDNAYNSFYHSAFYYTDWDMMWSKSPTTKLNAVLRAVSGSLVYVSDKVGETDADVLMPFVMPDGRLIKCDRQGVPTEDCLFADPIHSHALLKVQNTANGSGVVAAFNISESAEPITGHISPADVYDIPESDNYVIYEWFSGNAAVIDKADKLELTLNQYDCCLYTIIPAGGDVTVIGLADKYIPKAAVKQQLTFGKRSVIILKTGGRFAYVCNKPHSVLLNGNPVKANKNNNYYVVDCSDASAEVYIEIICD